METHNHILRKRLEDHLAELARNDLCVAFSGGVDSSLLLALVQSAAKKQGTRVLAVTFHTTLHPAADLTIARRVASELGVMHHVLEIDELKNPAILENPYDRCYLCKKELFLRLKEYAAAQGIAEVLEGSNRDDDKQYRPGIRAVEELDVKSPLRFCGITKEAIRRWAAELGITVAERPATPCMATRLPYGSRITPELLKRIEQGEAFLRGMGFRDLRLRVHQDIARLEVDSTEFMKVLKHQGEICNTLKKLGFSYITLDLEGFRSGSMDKNNPLSRKKA